MNIMIIPPTLTGGGAEKIVANLSLELSKYSDLYILTYMQTENEYSYAGVRLNIDCVGKSKFQKIVCAVKRVYLCRRLVKKYDIDCLLSFLPSTDYVNVLSKSRHTKSIVNVSSNMSVVYPSGISKKLRKFVLKRADRVVAISNGGKEDLEQNFGCDKNNISVIYNCCNISDIKEICTADAEYKEKKEGLPEKYIVSMGSFRHPKGHWHLIKAFAAVKDQIPDVSLVILGDGDYREKYEELIKNLGLEGRVFLPGFINPPFSIIAHSQLFVFSSVFEGFGNVIIEAMACGVPVLSTDCNFGPREILAPNTDLKNKAKGFEKCEYGCLLPDFGNAGIDVSGNISDLENAMGNAIVEIIEDTSLREEYIQKGIYYAESFDCSIFGEKWLSLIKELNGENDE